MDETSTPVAEARLAAFSEFLAEHLGLYFPRPRWRDLEKGLNAAARDFRCGDAAACVEMLMTSPLTRSRIEILASRLTVGETYFFREKEALEILEKRILPELIAGRREAGRKQLRVWSAGCCTGEETYTLAILLSRLVPDLKDWRVTVLGTDINPRFLRKAQRGVYGEWSFRDPPPWLKTGYFSQVSAGRFEILPAVKALVSFAHHNLVEDVYPALSNNTNGMDVVFCRNVLMYFAPRQARRVVANLHRCLTDGGWLIVSPTEASNSLLAPFQPVRFPEALLYRKAEGPAWPVAPAVNWAKAGMPWPAAPADTLAVVPPAAETTEAYAQPSGAKPESPVPSTPAPTGVPRLAPPVAAATELYQQGRYDEAEEVLTGLLAGGPIDAKALALLARIRANRGKLDEALEWCEKAIREDRLDPAVHYLKANILVEQGRLEEAAAGFRRVLYLDPRFPLAYFALGNLLKRQGKSREAARQFANALELLGGCDPHSVVPEAEGLTAGRLREVIEAGQECVA